jgi:dienelactone hydrolase
MSEEQLTAKSAKSAKGLGSEHPGGLLSAICYSPGRFVAGLLALLFAGALFWATGRDPFQRVWFKIKVPGQGKAECIAVLPKASPKSEVQSPKPSSRRWPVVVYLHGSGGSLLGDGNELRQMAEMGLAVVGMEYGGKAESRKQKAEIEGRSTGEAQASTADGFEAQFGALLDYLGRQPWADTNRIAWVGYSLGAQRLLAFALQHPERQPKLLVRLAGGWVPELESKVQSPKSEVPGLESKVQSLKAEVPGLESKVQSPKPSVQVSPADPSSQPFEAQGSGFKVQSSGSNFQSSPVASQPSTLNSQPSTSALLLHGERDEVFPLADAQRVAACLQTNGVPVELRVLPGESHGLGANRALVFRVIGEQCLARLKGAGALGNYRSILSWQAQAKPLWLFWTPALLWAVLCLCLRRKPVVGHASRLPPEAPLPSQDPRTQEQSGGTPAPLFRWEIGLRWFAAILAAAALAQTALHLVPPRLPISERTLGIARKHLVAPKERSDFEFLASKPFWPGKRLKLLLEHVELANYNRELINWKLDEQMYWQFILSPEIDPAADGDLNWRRPLWENFYPRIRKEQSPEAAAEIVVRFLRERVTIAEGNGLPAAVAEIWRRQITNERGFEAVYVAALRAVGIPARMGERKQAELFADGKWQAAPRPLVERWQ